MTDKPKTEIARLEQTKLAKPMGFSPENIQEAFKLAETLVSSGFLPSAVSTPAQALAIMLAGRDFGLSPMQSFRGLHVIEGTVSMSADLMVARVLSSGLAKYFRRIEGDGSIATYETHRKGDPEPIRLSFTAVEARAADLIGNDRKKNWKKYPAAMLRARAKSALARDVYPEIFFGIYTPDEGEDIAASAGYEAIDSGQEIQTITSGAQPTDEELQAVVDDASDKIADAGDMPALNKIATWIKTLPVPVQNTVRDIWLARRKVFKADPVEETRAAEDETDAEIVDEPEPEPDKVPVDSEDPDPVQTEAFGDEPWAQ